MGGICSGTEPEVGGLATSGQAEQNIVCMLSIPRPRSADGNSRGGFCVPGELGNIQTT